MIEVRFHGRKSQGSMEAARILAAAFRLAGRDATCFIPAGWEYAVNFEASLARADELSTGSRITSLVVFYPPLLEVPDIWLKFEHPHIVIVNTRNALEALDLCDGARVAAVDASGIARDAGPCYGIPSLVAPILGALAAAGNMVLGVHLMHALKETARTLKITQKDFERIMRALEAGYDSVRIRGGLSRIRSAKPSVDLALAV
ncbi:MAG: hypothetical protein OEL75_03840 [Kiritimatiellaceae bacterium]|nr:hypothetical protein [Kiritimatiellaceae bacterium]